MRTYLATASIITVIKDTDEAEEKYKAKLQAKFEKMFPETSGIKWKVKYETSKNL